jgi:predicted DNA-binding protein (MmcQ/YjbR family)
VRDASVIACSVLMTRDDFNAFCAGLPVTTHVVQWGGSDVWKVGGKVFAIGVPTSRMMVVTFKVSPLSYDLLKELPGLRPAPYLASRGFKWIQHHAKPGLSDADLRAYVIESHRLVSLGLSHKKRRELGLAD